jgi:Predicted membrane protein (DUF2232)
MIGTLLIAVAAGCASALMFASIMSGALISLLLLYLAPLPLMVAAIGWSPLAAVIGGIAACIGLGAVFDLSHGLAFAVTIVLPACWLGHLLLLGRPGELGHDSADAPALEWFPIGRIVIWIAAMASLVTFVALLTLGTDIASISASLRSGLTYFFTAVFNGPDAPSSAELDLWVDALIVLAPISAVVVAVPTLALNLWLAAKISATSGRLRRPWPDLRATALPPSTLAALSVALAFCFAGGMLGLFSKVIASALVMTYALIGFAVLHTLTLALRSRPFILSSTYVVVVMFSWPVLLVAALGIADAVFGLRQRYLRSRPPPLPAP